MPIALPPPDSAICARGLGKSFRGHWTGKRTEALKGLDLDVRRGEVFGYLGPNGAGKTTTLKLLTGLLRPSRGMGWLMGVPVTEVRSRAPLGFLPEQPYFYDYLSGLEFLEMLGQLSDLTRQESDRRARHWLGRVGLGQRPALKLRKYSKGMLQRLGLAAALMHDPEVVILDEPMSGLDPFGRRDVREIILEQRARGATIFFSTHILPDVEMLCDRAAVLLGGRLQRVVRVEELLDGGTHPVEVRLEGSPLVELPPAWSDAVVRSQRPGETVLTVRDGDLAQQVIAWIAERRLRIRAVTPQRANLEDIFLETAHSAGEAGAETARRQA